MRRCTSTITRLTVFVSIFLLFFAQSGFAASAAEIDQEAEVAYSDLLSSSEAAQKLASEAKAVLVFPDVVKAGLVIGGQYGTGALLRAGQTVGYYNTVAASYGLQVGAQKFGYALFFMTEEAVDFLANSHGWEIGVGPSVVVVDKGIAKALTTTTARDEIYAFFFDQKGLMAGLGLQGSKITRISPDK